VAPQIAGLAEAQEAVTFEASATIVRVGFNVELPVSGLAGCAGELVELGWFDGDRAAAASAQAPVDATGAAHVVLMLPKAGTFTAGLRGACLGPEPVHSDVVVFAVDPRITPTPDPAGAEFFWGEGEDRFAAVSVGTPVTLSVSGLQRCAGEAITLGFFAGPGTPDLFSTATVGPDGRTSVTLVPLEPGVDQRAAAIGSCLEGGFVLGARPFVSTARPSCDGPGCETPDGGTPAAPDLGTGAPHRPHSRMIRSAPIVLGLALVLAAVMTLGWRASLRGSRTR
jgi:hypothetical protein